MRKIFFIATILFLSGCVKETVRELEKETERLNDRIASVESQINSINAFLPRLNVLAERLNLAENELKQYGEALKDSLIVVEQKISGAKEDMLHEDEKIVNDMLARLEEQRQSFINEINRVESAVSNLEIFVSDIDRQVSNLREYAESLDNDSRDWVKATFATLEQFNGMSGTISGLGEELSQFKGDVFDEISESISLLESSMKDWVNNQLSAYSTVVQTEQKLSALKDELEREGNKQYAYLYNALVEMQNKLVDQDSDIIRRYRSTLAEYDIELGHQMETITDAYYALSDNQSDMKDIASRILDESAAEDDFGTFNSLFEQNKEIAGKALKAIEEISGMDAVFDEPFKKAESELIQEINDKVQISELLSSTVLSICESRNLIDGNTREIESMVKSLGELKEQIKKDYSEEIENAITEYDGVLSGRISELNTKYSDEIESIKFSISALQSKIDENAQAIVGIKSTIEDLNKEIIALKDKLGEIINMIQSAVVIPEYSDGSVGICGESSINFEIYPLSAAKKLSEIGTDVLSLKAAYTQTKALSSPLVDIPVLASKYEDGIFNITVDGSMLSNDFYSGTVSASARLAIESGLSNMTSAYFPLTYEATGNSLFSFSVSDGNQIYNSFIFEGNEIPVCVPKDTDLKHLVANFRTDAFSISINGVPQRSGRNIVDFSSPVTYTVSSKNGESKNYVVNVYVFDMPALCVSTPGQVNIESKEIWVEDSNVELWETDGKITDFGGTSIRGRGNSTWWIYDKKPYTLKLNSKSSVFGMPKDKRWNLLANAPDPTNLRNSVGFYLAKQTKSLDWTPNGQHVEFILNGKHQGLYYLCEHIKVSKDRVNIKEMKSSDVSEDKITGGYLLELDNNYDEVNKFKTEILQFPVMFKEPDEDVLVPEQLAYVQNYFNGIELMLTASPMDLSYREKLDLDSFAEYLLVKEIVFNGETSIPRSVYMHKDRNGKLKMGPVWDFDLDPMYQKWPHFNNTGGLWYNYLFNDPEFQTLFINKWTELKPKFLTVIDYIGEIRKSIKTSADRDNAMWPILESYQFFNVDYKMSFDDAVDFMVDGLKTRIQWIDEHVNDIETYSMD